MLYIGNDGNNSYIRGTKKNYFFNRRNAIQIEICTFIHVHDSLSDIDSFPSHINNLARTSIIIIIINIYHDDKISYRLFKNLCLPMAIKHITMMISTKKKKQNILRTTGIHRS